ncbi:MAG: hypothetical protein AB1457_18255, partial [Chloroflexota bacterium]
MPFLLDELCLQKEIVNSNGCQSRRTSFSTCDVLEISKSVGELFGPRRLIRVFNSQRVLGESSQGNLVKAGATSLAITSDAASYLQSRKETLTRLMKSLQVNLPDLA